MSAYKGKGNVILVVLVLFTSISNNFLIRVFGLFAFWLLTLFLTSISNVKVKRSELVLLLLIATKEIIALIYFGGNLSWEYFYTDVIIYSGLFLFRFFPLVNRDVVILIPVAIVMAYIDIAYLAQIALDGYQRDYINVVGSSSNTLATYNVIAFSYILYELLIVNKKSRRILLVLLLLLMFVTIILSCSRSILLLFGALLLLSVIPAQKKERHRIKTTSRRTKALYIWLVITLVAVLILSNDLSNYLASTTSRISLDIFSESNTRVVFWTDALDILKNGNLVLGTGTTNLTDTYIFDTVVVHSTQPHNFVLEILLHSGITGLAVYIYYAVFIIKNAVTRANKEQKRWIAIVFIMAYGAGMVHPVMSASIACNVLMLFCAFAIGIPVQYMIIDKRKIISG